MRCLLAAAALGVGCGGEPPARVPSVPSASASQVGAAETPCERAASKRARVTALLAEGKLDRALRALDKADRLCPAQAPASVAPRAQILGELGVNAPSRGDKSAHAGAAAALLADAERAEEKGDLAQARALYLKSWDAWHPNGLALARAGLLTKRQGDAPGAQRLFDRAAVELARETGQPLSPAPPPSSSSVQVVGVSADGARTAWVDGADVVVARHGEPGLRVHRPHTPGELVFSSDGDGLALVESHQVEVIDPRTGDVLRTFADEAGAASSMTDDLRPQSLVRWRYDAKAKKGHIEVVDTTTKAVERALDGPALEGVLALRRVGDDIVFVYTTRFATSEREETRDVTIQHDARCPGGISRSEKRWMKVHVVDEETKVYAQRIAIASGAGTPRELASMKLRTVRELEPRWENPTRGPGICHEPRPVFDDYAGEELIRWHLAADGTAVALHTGTFSRGQRDRLARAVALDFSGKKLGEVRSEAGIQALALAPKGDVLLWSEEESKSLRAQPTTRGAGSGWSAPTGYRPTNLVFSPDGAYVAGVAEHAVFAIGMRDGHVVDRPASTVSPHLGAYQVAASPDGAHVAVAATDHSVRLFHVDAATMTTVPPSAPFVVNTLSFSADSRVLAFSASPRMRGSAGDPRVHLVAAATGASLANLELGKRWVWDLGFSPDGGVIAAATREASIPTWDAATGAPRADVVVPGAKEVASVAYSPTRPRLAAAAESSVRVLDTGDGHVVATTAVPGAVRAVRFTPDGATLLVTTPAEVRAFDAESLLPRWPAPLATRGGLLAIAPDGADGATAGGDLRLFGIEAGATRSWTASAKAVGVAFVGPSVVSVDEHDVTVRDRASGDPRATMFVSERGALAAIATGELSVFGEADAVSCAAGPIRLPITVCSDRWVTPSAFARAFGRAGEDD